MVLTAYIVLSPAIGLSCHRRLRIATRNLDAGVEASGPHDFTVRKARALVSSAACVHHIPPHVRDDRDTPLEWDETASVLEVIWVNRETEYFCRQIWTGEISSISHDKFSSIVIALKPEFSSTR